MNKRCTAVITLVLFVIMALSAPVMAEDVANAVLKEQQQLSLTQAVQMALRNSETLEKARLGTQLADENREDAALMWHPSWTSNAPDGTEGIYNALLATRYAYSAAEKNETITEDTIVADTIKKYYEVLMAAQAVGSKEKNLASVETAHKIAKLNYEVGLGSWLQMLQAETNLTTAQATLSSAQNDLAKAYVSLNQQVGLDLESSPQLTDQPNYAEYVVDNLSSKVNGIISDSPTRWISREGAKLQNRLVDAPGSTEQDDLEAQQAELSVDAMDKATANALYSLYYGIKNMETSYLAAQEGLKLAQQGLKIAELKLEIGMGTKAEVLAAQNSLAAAEQGLFTLTCQHELLKVAFEKPWTASAIAGGSGNNPSQQSGM